ncbi:hypothetical protein [Actinomadura bangladeshensis]|uniref:hypothetical protein n=2 Tax=Actinomadura bangladeshensis TaxID=453573 RepID=UPI0031E06915
MPVPRRDRRPGADRPHRDRTPPPRTGRLGAVRRAAEPLAWWTVLLAVYLGLVPTISITEITVGALASAAGAAAAVAGRRALLTPGTARDPDPGQAPGQGPGSGRGVEAAGVAAALVRLPGRVAADTARITVRGASGGAWTPLPVAPGPAARGAATLLMSVAPGTYVGGIDPRRGLLRVHRLVPAPSPFERRLRAAGLVGGPGEAP